MVNNPALENAIIDATHPIFLPLEGKSQMHARYASSGYFEGVPEDVHILAAESEGDAISAERPTFIEYDYSKGYIIAGLQCFHDRDGSGRGPLMESVISYALNRSKQIE